MKTFMQQKISFDLKYVLIKKSLHQIHRIFKNRHLKILFT